MLAPKRAWSVQQMRISTSILGLAQSPLSAYRHGSRLKRGKHDHPASAELHFTEPELLAGFIASSLFHYKAATDTVASWLANTAKSCGYSIDLPTIDASSTTTNDTSSSSNDNNNANTTPAPLKRLKGKARKLARNRKAAAAPTASTTASRSKPVFTRKLTLGEFVSLADYIAAASNPPVKVPASVVKALDCAISIRQKHGRRVTSKMSQDAESQAQVRRHNHFVGVLEHVREVLRPRMPIDQVKDPLTQKVGEQPAEPLNTLQNRFEGLDVQKPSEWFLQAPDVTPMASSGTASPEVNYEAELRQDMEKAYLGFDLLMQDFRSLRTVILRTWKGYQLGLFDLVTVSLVTNTAINIAKRMQEDVQKLFDKHGGSAKMLNTFYAASCAVDGEDPNFRERPGDDLNFRMYDAAESIMMPTFMLLQSFDRLAEPGNILPYKPGYYGTFDPASNRSKKSARERYQEDKIVMLEVLSEFLAFHRGVPSQTFEDEFTRGLRLMFDTHEIPIWLVFAAQVFLDIHHALRGQVQEGLLRSEGLRKVHGGLHPGEPQIPFLAFHCGMVETERWGVPCYAKEHSLVGGLGSRGGAESKAPGEFRGDVQVPEVEPALPRDVQSEPQVFLPRTQPVLPGRMGSIMYPTHLYDAVCSEGLVRPSWQDMELVMSWRDEIFVGEAPHNPEDYLKRFNPSIGWSTASYARNRRQTSRLPESKNGPKIMQLQGSVSRTFMDHYCRGSQQTDLTEEDLEKILGMNFDYLTLHRSCWRLLRRVREACDPCLRDIFGVGYLERESQLPFVVGSVFMGVANTDVMGKRLAAKEDIVKSKLLMTAGGAVDEMIETGEGALVVDSLHKRGYPVEVAIEQEPAYEIFC
ncbi:hypothetical protein P170DRAFT_28669 [Aspergillus steynii IBT 23096]|uniref:DUF6604 domain-containing protein n=1 Tax=Aspergillus steynii IBT 23096 TaxID=1392250 RepID=A0A2I2GQ15_9EURO|nr:uncharacterized protein P170DRAFT_28669 [Aspergillus steynii IBT 23096]PLB54962.1 hypothetical protein P170DRAFT_28669 [Aspergillus steynii IBT 23096]